MKAYFSHFFTATVALVVASFVTPAFAQEDAGAKVYQNGIKSAVKIFVKLDGGRASGSGSIVNLKEGYVITNWHVVRGALDVQVVCSMFDAKGKLIVDNEKYLERARAVGMKCKVIASDEKVDLAIIRITEMSKLPKTAKAVHLSGSSPDSGSPLHSIGNPGASEAWWIYTPGKVRSVYVKKWVAGAPPDQSHHECKVIEATSPTTFGDSGGPCFNDKGEQVGMCQGGKSALAAQAYSWFVDVTEIKGFLKRHKIKFNLDDGSPQGPDSVTAADSKKDADPKTDTTKKDPPKKEPAADELAKQEKDAAGRLKLISNVAKDPSKKSYAVEQLQKLIKLYPKTQAAKEAKDLLKELQ